MLRKRKVRRVVSLGLLPFPKTNSPSTEDAVLHDEASDQLWAAVDDLGDRHRLPILLRYAHQMPIREIAQVLGIREGTVRSRLHYAIRKLEKRLGGMDDLRQGEEI